MKRMITATLRLGARVYRRACLARLKGKSDWRQLETGIEMFVDPEDSHDRMFYLHTYEPHLVRIIRRIVKPGDCCLDVGAHKGYLSLLLGKAAGASGCVFSFEPDSRARLWLERNCDRNGYNVVVLPYALGDENGTCEFALSRELGWSSRFPNELAQAVGIEKVAVPVRRLDELVWQGELAVDLERLSFVKIDVEGSELLVLQGMRELLTRTKPVLWVEINHRSLRAGGFSAQQVEGLLKDLGFSLYVPRLQRRFLLLPSVRLDPVTDLAAQYPDFTNILAARNSEHDFPASWISYGSARKSQSR